MLGISEILKLVDILCKFNKKNKYFFIINLLCGYYAMYCQEGREALIGIMSVILTEVLGVKLEAAGENWIRVRNLDIY